MPFSGHNIGTANNTAHTMSQQLQLPAQGLQKTWTVKKQPLIREEFKGPYLLR